MENQYLIPANTKKGQLILSFMRPVDLAILLTGATITFTLLIIIGNTDLPTWVMILGALPLLITAGLVFHIANYHNVLVAIQEVIRFYSNNRNYKWRGWCAVYESKRE